MFCHQCGKELMEGIKFCPYCGARLMDGIGFIGNISDRHDKKKIAENKAAAELIEQYRKLGYKI